MALTTIDGRHDNSDRRWNSGISALMSTISLHERQACSGACSSRVVRCTSPILYSKLAGAFFTQNSSAILGQLIICFTTNLPKDLFAVYKFRNDVE